MTLHDCGMALLHPHAANYFLSDKRPKATGNPHPNLVPYSKFKTKTCEIFIAAGNDPAFRKFCEFLGIPDVAKDERFATNGARVINRDALTKILEKRFSTEDGHDLTRRMLTVGLPAGPVLHVDEAMAADHTAFREMVADIGDFRALNTPIKLSRTPGGARTRPPRFNQHGREVLLARGFSEAEIAALEADGVIVDGKGEVVFLEQLFHAPPHRLHAPPLCIARILQPRIQRIQSQLAQNLTQPPRASHLINPKIPRRHTSPGQQSALIRKTLPHPQRPQQHLLKHILPQRPIPHRRPDERPQIRLGSQK
jgi:hypothetical protein